MNESVVDEAVEGDGGVEVEEEEYQEEEDSFPTH